MKLLLDTHIWLWSIGEPRRLSRRITHALDNPENELWLSPISLWETLLLSRKGRLEVGDDFDGWLKTALEMIPVTEAPLTFEVASALTFIKLPHSDPADLFLAASARTFDLTLVTADRNLIQSKGFSVLANS